MESLSDTLWDIVICGTGLQQSLLALALSRSGKKILHIDPNEFYGSAEAAFSLQDAESWAHRVSTGSGGLFAFASITKPEGAVDLSSSRAYSLALAPKLIHARSTLLSRLVSSRAYRQVEFLAVGSFYIFRPPQDTQNPTLVRIPSTREEVFSTTDVSSKAKRQLMKFLKFVLDSEASPQLETWQPYADTPLTGFLQQEFNMDAELQMYIITFTLSLEGNISTKDGLAVIRRHLSSMGLYGPGFAAIYPKWGGLSEITQISCRAGAVGGAVYMLGTGIKEMETVENEVKLQLTSGDTVRTRMLVRASDSASGQTGINRLVAVISSPLSSMFQSIVEGAPRPAVAVIAFPAGSLSTPAGRASEHPVYLSAHSSDTGECPVGQSVLYLTTLSTPDAKAVLERALDIFICPTSGDEAPQVLYQLQYEQRTGPDTFEVDGPIFTFPAPSPSLSFDDSTLVPVREAWKRVMGDAAVYAEYLVFDDRDVALDDNDVYDTW
ncbi:hypothetical protein N657DRAFT_570811 [Parathielavia appendiculata]|uniref:Rab proteins geranylgeranyltransferase n=1 Tax=Parathielavia appendiculata TaxID=2587402 RepID=A0AAN6Z5V7_9PEZI|nr:hypothetical protein N657DRAFT_570811 [Parathielavia appendiculata]